MHGVYPPPQYCICVVFYGRVCILPQYCMVCYDITCILPQYGMVFYGSVYIFPQYCMVVMVRVSFPPILNCVVDNIHWICILLLSWLAHQYMNCVCLLSKLHNEYYIARNYTHCHCLSFCMFVCLFVYAISAPYQLCLSSTQAAQ